MSPAFSKNYQAGFTLAEMITVVAIIIIMTGVVLANFPDFRDRSSLELVAQEVALVIRQAQAYGSQTRAVLGSSSTAFPSYGIYFNVNATNPKFKDPKSFRLFADVPGLGVTGRYSDAEPPAGPTCGSALAECREIYNLEGGITIAKLETCPSTGVCTDITSTNALNVVFTRPNPEAQFTSDSGADLCGGTCSYAKITLSSARTAATQCVYVWTTGHIFTKPSCP